MLRCTETISYRKRVFFKLDIAILVKWTQFSSKDICFVKDSELSMLKYIGGNVSVYIRVALTAVWTRASRVCFSDVVMSTHPNWEELHPVSEQLASLGIMGGPIEGLPYIAQYSVAVMVQGVWRCSSIGAKTPQSLGQLHVWSLLFSQSLAHIFRGFRRFILH